MLGLTDCSAIATERFSQWIIEDDFCSPRPDWRAAGVRYVDNIAPYEEIKTSIAQRQSLGNRVLRITGG